MPKPKFDPNKPFEIADGKPKFDPSKPYQSDETPNYMSEEMETFGKSAADSALLGYLPQVQGAIAGARGGDYISERDQAIEDLSRLKQENPKSALAGNLTGIVGPAVLTGGLGAASKGASLLGKIGQGAKIGALQGAVANPGDVKGDVGLQFSDRAQNAALGGIVGGAATAAAETIPALSKRVSEYLKKKANINAYEALAPRKRFVSQDLAKNKIEDIGEIALDRGIIKGMPRSKEELLSRASGLQEVSGKEIGDTIESLSRKEADMLGQQAAEAQGLAIPGQSLPKGGISKASISKALEEDLIKDIPLESVRKTNSAFQEMIDDFNQGEHLGIKEAQDLKVKLGNLIKWDRLPGADIPVEEQFYRSLYKNLNKGTEDAAEVLAGKFGGLDKLKDAKNVYGASKRMEEILKDKIAAEQANRFISPSDYGMGAAGAVVGGLTGDPEDRLKSAMIGASLGGANKLMRAYGSQVLAKSQNEISKLATKAGMKASEYKSAFPLVAERIREKYQYQAKDKEKEGNK